MPTPGYSNHPLRFQKEEKVSNNAPGARELMYFPWLTIPSGAWLRHATLYWDGIRMVGDEGVANALEKIRPEMNTLAREGLLKHVPIDAFAAIEREGLSEQRNRERDEILSSSRGTAFLNSPAAESVRKRMAMEIALQLEARRDTGGKDAALEMLDDFSADPTLVEMGIRVQTRAAKRLGVPVESVSRILIAQAILWSALAVRDYCWLYGPRLEAGTDYLLPGELLYTPLPGTHREPALGISLANILPQPVPDAPIERILRLKDKHQLEYLRFRQAVNEMRMELPRAASVAEFHHILGAFGDELAAKRLELSQKMHRDGVGTVFGMIKAVINSVPSAFMLEVGAQIWGRDLPPSLRTAAIAAPPVIAILEQGWTSRRKSREFAENSEVGYLFWASKMGLINE